MRLQEVGHFSAVGICRLFVLGLLLCLCFAPATAQAGLCAEVRIQIKQSVSLERQAFDATLRIHNGLSSVSVDDVSVNVLFTDGQGNPVVASSDPTNTDATFFIRLDGMDGINAVDGTGVVAPETTATVHWLIIPSASAGGASRFGKLYMVGARLRYSMNGQTKTVEVVPDSITVLPQPRLKLDYFLAGEVYADDAFTPEVEPSVPFTLGVRVSNVGAGVGHHVRIQSAQPEIVENDQGLLIGFKIVGGYVDDQPAEPSLLLDFGKIAPGGVRMGRWLMTTTLSGRFISMDARISHAAPLGGELTSLIVGQPETHLLVHDVLVDLAGRDAVRDFLALDGGVLRVYESNGTDTKVTDRSDSASLQNAGVAHTYELSFPQTAGLAYIKVPDPLQGAANSIRVRDASGQLLPKANVWFSKTRVQGSNWDYFLNVFDPNGGGDYAVVLDAPPATSSLEGVVYVDANGNGTREAGEVGLEGVAVNLAGTTALGSIATTVVSRNDGTYAFRELAEGTYSVSVADVPGYANGIHQAGSAGGGVGAATIASIALGADQHAVGYVFAKTPIEVTGKADLALAALTGDTTVETGKSTSVTVEIHNAGPEAVHARATLALPAALTVSRAAAQSGGFNAATGIWNAGVLAPGSTSSLVIEGRYSEPGSYQLSATVGSVDATVPDPHGANNHRILEVVVEGQPLSITASLAADRVSDVLLLVSCAEQAAPGCASARAQRWDALLARAGIHHRVETELDRFATALRSGDWNVVWIDGARLLRRGTLAAEVRESVRRGGMLVLSGPHGPVWQRFEDLAGVTYGGEVQQGGQPVHTLLSEYFADGQLQPAGVTSTFAAASGRVLGTYASGQAAIVASRPGPRPRILMFGFDPLPAVEALAAPNAFLGTLATGMADLRPDPVLGGLPLPFRISASGTGMTSGELAVLAGFPEPFSLLMAEPVPDDMTPGSVGWLASLPTPDEPFTAAYVLRAPDATGTYAMMALAQWQTREAEDQLMVHVRSGPKQIAVAAQALEQLAVAGQPDVELKQQALTAFDAATAAHARGDAQHAITRMLAALEALDGIASGDADAVAVEVSWALLVVSRDARFMGDRIFADGFDGGHDKIFADGFDGRTGVP